MMENKSDKGGFWRRQSFLLPPLTAAVVLLCQQMASSNPSGVVTVNILLLVLNFFSYVGLLRGEKSTEKSVAIAAAGFITLMAFVFNTCVAGIPTPLSDTGIFMNSLCGMWVLVAVVQGISLLIQAVLQPTVEQETGASETNVWNRLQKVGGQLKPKATNSQEIILMLLRLTDSNLNHTGIYLYSKGKIMIHLTFDYKTDEKCTTPGQYLKYHRTFQGFTTRELAEKVGIVPATLVLYENDRHPIKHSTAVALANALGIDRNRLLDKYTAFVDYPYSSLLKKVRQELSLTQMQMAEVIGIGQTSYSGWEREIRVPRRKEYEKILAALKKLKVNVDTYLCHPAST